MLEDILLFLAAGIGGAVVAVLVSVSVLLPPTAAVSLLMTTQSFGGGDVVEL